MDESQFGCRVWLGLYIPLVYKQWRPQQQHPERNPHKSDPPHWPQCFAVPQWEDSCYISQDTGWVHEQPLTLEPTLVCTRSLALNWCYVTVMCRFLTGDGDSATPYDQAAARRLAAIESVLWDAERGAWFDYNLVTRSKHFEFYPSNLSPVWAQCYYSEMAEKAVEYLKVGGHPSCYNKNASLCLFKKLVHPNSTSTTLHWTLIDVCLRLFEKCSSRVPKILDKYTEALYHLCCLCEKKPLTCPFVDKGEWT